MIHYTSLDGNYTVNDFKHTLVKELKAYKYNNKTDTYEIHTYQQREVIYIRNGYATIDLF